MAATETDATRRSTKPSLISGHEMTCPRCKKPQDILAFQRFGEIDEFAHETAPIYKCPKSRGGCGWIFAPSDHAVLLALNPEGIPEDLKIE